MNSLKQCMEAFNRVYNRTAKVVTFDKHWKLGLQSVGGAVSHIDHRIILSHGDIAKTKDDFGRRILLIGTVYGLIAINETIFKTNDPAQPLHYTTTPALASIWQSYHGTHFPTSDYLHASGVPDFLSDKFLTDLADLATQEMEFGRVPGDGMKTFITAKAKQSDDRRKGDTSMQAKLKGRRNNDHKGRNAIKSEAFKNKTTEVAAAEKAKSDAKPKHQAKPMRKMSGQPRVQKNVELKKEVATVITDVEKTGFEEHLENFTGSIIQQDIARRQSQLQH